MADSDKDGLTDEVERILGTDPLDKDTDNDGLMDGAEGKLGADPKNPDSDGDGFADGSEVAQRRSPWNPDPPHPHGARDRPYQPTADDPDADGLDEMMEGLAGTDPNDPDTDGDGLGDSVEAIRGTNPKARFGDEPGDASNDLDDARTEVFTRRSQFVEHARIQIGDKYKFGAETTPGQDDPDAFDSSELVQWAAGRAGVNLPDGSWNQYKHLHQAGGSVTVKDALGTPGALVFGFSSDPLATSGRPARSYVGISLGDGRVIDVSERTGQVSELDPGSFYTHAAVIPEFEQDLDSDGDGATNWDERRRNSDPLDPAKTSQSEAQPPVAPKSPDDTSAATDAGDQVAQAADASERSEDVLESGTSMASAGTQLASLSSDIGDPAATAAGHDAVGRRPQRADRSVRRGRRPGWDGIDRRRGGECGQHSCAGRHRRQRRAGLAPPRDDARRERGGGPAVRRRHRFVHRHVVLRHRSLHRHVDLVRRERLVRRLVVLRHRCLHRHVDLLLRRQRLVHRQHLVQHERRGELLLQRVTNHPGSCSAWSLPGADRAQVLREERGQMWPRIARRTDAGGGPRHGGQHQRDVLTVRSYNPRVKDLAPSITRQRLLVEGFYEADVDEASIARFLEQLTEELELRTYGAPTIFSPAGVGRDENAGYDAFVPLIDSGISLYVWTSSRFLALVLFTCKRFEATRAVDVTRRFFAMTEVESQGF